MFQRAPRTASNEALPRDHTEGKLSVTKPIDPHKGDNVYFNDPESAAEMVRLIDQDRLGTEGALSVMGRLPCMVHW